MLTFPICDSQKINFEETLAQFYFYQLFNYNFMQFCVLVYVCGYIWWLFLYLEVLLFIIAFIRYYHFYYYFYYCNY